MLHVVRAQTWIRLSGWRWNGTGCFDCWSCPCNLSIQRRASKLHIHCQCCTVFLLKSWSSKSRSFVACFLVSVPVYAKGKLSESVYKRTCDDETLQDRSVSTWVVLLSKKHKRICVLSPRSLGSMERSNTFETSSSHSSSRHWVCRLEITHASKILSGWDVFSWVPPQSLL